MTDVGMEPRINQRKAPFPWFGVIACTDAGEVMRLTRAGKPITPRRIDMPDRSRGYRNVVLPDPDTNRWRTYKAHRIIWSFFNGPIPDGLQIDHINGVKHDNRLGNLRVVTPGQNIAASYADGRPRPWSATEKKYAPEEIRAARASGLKLREISDLFGISVSHASRLTRGGDAQ